MGAIGHLRPNAPLQRSSDALIINAPACRAGNWLMARTRAPGPAADCDHASHDPVLVWPTPTQTFGTTSVPDNRMVTKPTDTTWQGLLSDTSWRSLSGPPAGPNSARLGARQRFGRPDKSCPFCSGLIRAFSSVRRTGAPSGVAEPQPGPAPEILSAEGWGNVLIGGITHAEAGRISAVDDSRPVAERDKSHMNSSLVCAASRFAPAAPLQPSSDGAILTAWGKVSCFR